MTTKLLSEAEKMRRVQGIDYVDGATDRHAHVTGSGSDVCVGIRPD
jgi:hypothetical protein